jgi:hypothetical protein
MVEDNIGIIIGTQEISLFFAWQSFASDLFKWLNDVDKQ